MRLYHPKAFAVLFSLLVAAIFVLWVRSFWRADAATEAGLPAWSGYSTMGAITIDYTDAGMLSSNAIVGTSNTSPTWTAIRQRSFLFHYGTRTDYDTVQSGGLAPIGVVLRHYKSLTIPYWAPTLLFAGLAWLGFRRARRQARTNAGRCMQCNYDLRAHKAGDKCPECGANITPLAAKPSSSVSITT